MIISRTYNTAPGSNFLWHPSLASVRILLVKREGVEYDRVAPLSATGRQFFYFVSRIFFDNSIPFNPGEKVWVLYEK